MYENIDLAPDYFTWQGRISNKITLPFKIDAQTQMKYRGPSSDNQNERHGTFSINQVFSKIYLIVVFTETILLPKPLQYIKK